MDLILIFQHSALYAMEIIKKNSMEQYTVKPLYTDMTGWSTKKYRYIKFYYKYRYIKLF